MLQRLPIALVQGKAGKHIWILIKWNQTSHAFFASSRKFYEKSIQQHNKFNKFVKQNKYRIYEFWE